MFVKENPVRKKIITIKFISISRLRFRLNIFNISETKRFEQYPYISKKKKLVLNKISSIKSWGVVE